LAIIGLAAPGGHYSTLVAKYLDYVSWIKVSLMNATGLFLSVFNIPTHTEPGFLIRINGGRGVIIAMSCVGFGVYSFWISFVAANNGKFWKKIRWIIIGLFALWLINDIRITLFLLALNKGWPMPLGIDHHTWFNIFAYLLIFIMIGLYDRVSGNRILNTAKNPTE
jgi:exosortase/archaeosortase family protein